MENSFTIINWNSIVDILKAFAAIGAGGRVMSLITSALVGANRPSAAKQMVAFLTCLVGAFIPIVVSGVELTNMAVVLPLMWIGSQLFDKAWFKPHGIAPWIETLFLNNTTVPVQRFAGPNDLPVVESRDPDHYRDQFHRWSLRRTWVRPQAYVWKHHSKSATAGPPNSDSAPSEKLKQTATPLCDWRRETSGRRPMANRALTRRSCTSAA